MTGTEPTSPQSPPPVTLVGHRWARHAHDLVDFLGGNHVPYRWLDMDRGHAAERFLAEVDATESPLPVAVVGDEVLSDPSVDELADALGMHVHATAASYDLGIVGAGPAGLAAAVYGGSEGLRTVLIEAHAPGGQAGTSSRIENYLGFPEGVSGAELTDRAVAQTRKFGVEIVAPQRVERMELRSGYKILHLADGSHVTCRALVVASGVSYRALRTPGFDRGDDRVPGGRGRARVRHRLRQLGRPGRHVLLAVRGACHRHLPRCESA
jgi:thioredoxin reductase (NADPH)